MLEVVAAYIRTNGKVLLCQRGPQKSRALQWEFPGGKVEPGETKPEALIRECMEELSVTLEVGAELADVRFDYPDVSIHLTLLDAVIRDGTPQKTEHADLRWVSPAAFERFALCPADRALVRCLHKAEA